METNRLAWRIPEFADAIGVGRTKGYEIVGSADGPPTITVNGVRLVPVDGARKWIERKLAKEGRTNAAGA